LSSARAQNRALGHELLLQACVRFSSSSASLSSPLITGQDTQPPAADLRPDQRRIDLLPFWPSQSPHHTEDVVLSFCEHVGENAHGARPEAGAATEAAEEPMAMSVPPALTQA